MRKVRLRLGLCPTTLRLSFQSMKNILRLKIGRDDHGMPWLDVKDTTSGYRYRILRLPPINLKVDRFTTDDYPL